MWSTSVKHKSVCWKHIWYDHSDFCNIEKFRLISLSLLLGYKTQLSFTTNPILHLELHMHFILIFSPSTQRKLCANWPTNWKDKMATSMNSKLLGIFGMQTNHKTRKELTLSLNKQRWKAPHIQWGRTEKNSHMLIWKLPDILVKHISIWHCFTTPLRLCKDYLC